MARQDDELATMRADLIVTAGTAQDLEIPYVESLWIPTVSAGTPFEAWMAFWDSVTLPAAIPAGHFNDRAFAWLGGLTHTGALADRWTAYWAAEAPP